MLEDDTEPGLQGEGEIEKNRRNTWTQDEAGVAVLGLLPHACT